jgi:hypothetical protein
MQYGYRRCYRYKFIIIKLSRTQSQHSDIGEVPHHFTVVNEAFAVVVTLIDILLCPYLP